MKKAVLFLFVFIALGKVNAQSPELDKVTKLQLEEKQHPTDTSAVAAILFKKNKTNFVYDYKEGFSLRTECSIKIKIYKKEGLDWANFEIPYYVGYENLEKEMVTIKKAFTYNLENSKVVKTKVSSDGKFKEKVNELWETKIITFPNVKEGSIIELKYELKSQNLSELPVFQYQYKIPVDYAQYNTEVPGFYLYNAIKLGYVDVVLTDKLENASQSYSNEHGQSRSFGYQQINTMYEVANVPALIEEDYVSNMDDFYGKIEHELKTIHYPEEEPKQIATTWENVAKSIYGEKEFGAELSKTSYFINDLKKILDKIDSKEERIKIIFEYVKNKMTWNGKYGYYTKKGVETAYQENSGNVAEINLMLTAMLKIGGLDANPVLLSTKNNGVASFPNRSKFNYVIAAVLLDGKQILLDATEKFASVNCLPIRDLNNKGRLINKDGSSDEIDLMPKFNSNDIINLIVNIDQEGQVTGQVREQYFDYNALYFRQKYGGLTNESRVEKLEKIYPGIEVDNYEIKNEKSVYEPVIENYTIKNNNVIEIIGDKMFFSPMLYLTTTQNPFKQENRQYPVDFAFPSKDKYLIIINIPDGYKFESIPKPKGLNLESKNVTYSYAASNTEKQITITINFDTNASVIQSQNYEALKEFYKQMIEKQTEKIVLKKV